MNRVMSLIGSASGCKFRLADPSVSPFHCSLLRTPLGLWVVDLLGPDGVSVNDALVRYALLADDDVLKVGRYRIRVRSRFAGRDRGSRSFQLAICGVPLRKPRGGIRWSRFSPTETQDSSGSPSLRPATWARARVGDPRTASVRSAIQHRLGVSDRTSRSGWRREKSANRCWYRW